MPIGILIIKMKLIKYNLTAKWLAQRVDDYFDHIKGDPKARDNATIAKKSASKKAKDDSIWEEITIGGRQPEPPTITGLSLFIGFNSLNQFYEYKNKQRFAAVLERAHLKIEAAYEKKLHLTSAAGAVFALKNLGWNDEKQTTAGPGFKTLEIKLLESGPAPAATEKEVTL